MKNLKILVMVMFQLNDMENIEIVLYLYYSFEFFYKNIIKNNNNFFTQEALFLII